jgi:dihydropyrimidine dehydrogenase (NAD+) subunit PreA
VSLINTINSIIGVDLDTSDAEPSIDGKGTHGGYCGPAVKPIALNMVAEIARDPKTPGLPISGIGGITTWRDAAEFMALGAGNVQVCTAAMTYGFKIVEEMIAGCRRTGWTRRASPRSTTSSAAPCRTSPTGSTSTSTTSPRRVIDQDLCIKCGRCHIACEDTSHQAITKR